MLRSIEAIIISSYLIVLGIILTMCQPEQVCLVGDSKCEENKVFQCIETNDGADWIIISNCAAYKENEILDHLGYTCCSISGGVNCFLTPLCDLQEQGCENIQAWLEFECKEYLDEY